MTPDVLRLALAAEVLATTILMGRFLGALWGRRLWPTRVIIAGVALVLVYSFAGQLKGYFRHVIFDGVSWGGVLAFTVLLVGLVAWELVENTGPTDQRGA